MERNDHRDDPQRVERRMDETPMADRDGGVERDSLHGSDRVVEREVMDDRGSRTAREALQDERGHEDSMGAARSGGMENRAGDRSEPVPGEEMH